MKRGLTLLLLLALLCSGCRNMPQTGYAYVKSKPSPVAEATVPALAPAAGQNSAAQKTYLYEWNLLLPDAPKKYAFQWGSFTRADIEQLMPLIRLRQWESMDGLLSAFEGGIWPDIEHTEYGADTELWVSFEQFEQANAAVLCVQEGGGQTLLLMFTVQGETYVPCCALGGIRDFASCRVEPLGGAYWIIYESMDFRRDRYTTWFNTWTGQVELSYYTDVSGSVATETAGAGRYQILAGEPEITGREHADFSVAVPVTATLSDWGDVSFETAFMVLLRRDAQAQDFYAEIAPEDYALDGTLCAKRYFSKELRALLKEGDEREKAWALQILQAPIIPRERRPDLHKPAVLYPLTYLSSKEVHIREYPALSYHWDSGITQWQMFELCEAVNQAQEGTLLNVFGMFEAPRQRTGEEDPMLRFDRVSNLKAIYYEDAIDIRYRERGADKGLLVLFFRAKNGSYVPYRSFAYAYDSSGGRFPVLEDGVFTIPIEKINGLYAWESTVLAAPGRSWISLLQDIPEQDGSHTPRIRVEASFLPAGALERDYSRDGTLRMTVEFPAARMEETQMEFSIWEAQVQDKHSDILLSGHALLHPSLREAALCNLKAAMEGGGVRGERAGALFEDICCGKLGGKAIAPILANGE